MTVPAPDPRPIRAASLDELRRLGLPTPPAGFPLVWEPGDQVELRPTGEIEARTAILHVVLARCFGMPPQAAMSWLLDPHLVEPVTPPEWQFVVAERGDQRSFALHLDALFALAWLLGMSKHLDPTAPTDERLMERVAAPAGRARPSRLAGAHPGRAAGRRRGRGDARPLLLPRLGLPRGGAAPDDRCPA